MNEPKSYLNGAVTAYQDADDFAKKIYENCPVESFKETLKVLSDGFQKKADNAKFLIAEHHDA